MHSRHGLLDASLSSSSPIEVSDYSEEEDDDIYADDEDVQDDHGSGISTGTGPV